MTAPVRHADYVEAALNASAARISRSFAAGLRPAARISPAEWALKYRRFPADSAYPGPWRHDTAPYLVEIMECLSPHHPCSELAIQKCAQSGGSASAENWIGFISDVAPGPLMYVQQTISAAKDWLAEKFWPMVEATPRLNPERKGSIRPKRSRDGEGTTALRVRFKRGGWMLIAGANSSASLRQHSIRYVIEDDLDGYPDDLDKQGSPEGMITARLRTYARLGLSKRLAISTPTNAGASKIERRYSKSDQRRFHLKCRHCGSRFLPLFEDLRWPSGQPHLVELVNPCCGVHSAHWEKAEMSLADGWLATVSINGEQPPRVMTEEEFQTWRRRDLGSLPIGFDIPGIISAFLTWADLCKGFVDAQGDVNKLRVWTNLEKGETFVLKGEAPPAEALNALREQDWGKGQMPFGPVVLTMGCDVQGDGIYYEKLGWALGLENWSLDHGFLPGKTDVPGEGAWRLLEDLATSKTAFPGGRAFEIDFICVDANYNTEAAKAFCKRSAKRLPVFGREGWQLPILGRGQAIHYEAGGWKRKKRPKKAGEEAHLVGTYGAKYSWFGFLRTSIEHAERQLRGESPDPMRGRIHFGRDADAAYFDMLTSESCVVELKNNIPRRVWKVQPGRENHYLDCRIYNRAAAEAMALESRSEADWLELREHRYSSADPFQGDLIALATRPAPDAAAGGPAAAPVAGPAVAPVPRAAAGNDHNDGDWIVPPEKEWF